jgi:hypothetical protein
MAGQFHLAHSRSVIGAGILAGGPWACAQSAFADVMPGPGQAFINVQRAVNGCMLNRLEAWGIPDPKKLSERARRLAGAGKIDPLANAASDRIYLFAGRNDRIVVPEMTRYARDFYREIGMADSNIAVVDSIGAGHAFVTLDKGSSCETSEPPYIVDCDYDQAGAMLAHILGKPPRTPAPYSGRMTIFDQTEFAADMPEAGLASEGVLYVPNPCGSGERCSVHILFHGCDQNRTKAGSQVIFDTGILRWADAYRLIVLFPQAEKSSVNPKGCWDWWGYTGSAFLTRDGVQIKAVRQMLDRLGQSAGTR